MIKKIQRTSLSERFKSLSKKVERRFKKEGLREDVIDEAMLKFDIEKTIQYWLAGVEYNMDVAEERK